MCKMRLNISKPNYEAQNNLLLPISNTLVFRQNIFRKNTNTTSGMKQLGARTQNQMIQVPPPKSVRHSTK